MQLKIQNDNSQNIKVFTDEHCLNSADGSKEFWY
jgi:hypothetical protein